MLIRVVYTAHDAEDATGIARSLFEGMEAQLCPPFDYGKVMTEDGSWSQSFPESIHNEGSARADSEMGREIIENGWVSTTRELSRRMAVIRKGFEEHTDEELLEGRRVEANVEPWNPLGLAQNEEEFIDSYSSEVRYAMHSVGEYAGPVYYLYNENGIAVRSHSEYERLLESITSDGNENENEDLSYFVTPVDVHY